MPIASTQPYLFCKVKLGIVFAIAMDKLMKPIVSGVVHKRVAEPLGLAWRKTQGSVS